MKTESKNRSLAQRRKVRQELRNREKTRNPKFETISNDQNFQTSPFRISQLGFKFLGLFRISIFGFRILFRWRLGAINLVEVVLLNI